MAPQGIGMDLVPISGDEEKDYGYKNHGHVDDDGNSEQEPDFADDTRRWRGRGWRNVFRAMCSGIPGPLATNIIKPLCKKRQGGQVVDVAYLKSYVRTWLGVERKVVFGLILDSVVHWFQNSEFLYTLSNPQEMHYEVPNSSNDIHASQNLCGCIQPATIIRYSWKAVGIVVLICYPHNTMYVTHLFADVFDL